MDYDVIIIGGGVTGTALLYVFSKFTNLRRILTIERRIGVGLVNSNATNNSQTLHSGEIETNFTLEKALTVNGYAKLLAGFLERHAPQHAFRRLPKMVIGVGAEEVAFLTKRHETFKPHFPSIQLLNRAQIAAVEPRVVDERPKDQPLIALASAHGYGVNYQELSHAFLDAASHSGGQRVDSVFDRNVDSIVREGEGFRIRAGDAEYTAKTVIVAAGPASLLFAHALGYGLQYALLPVAGSFYRAHDVSPSR